MLSMDKVSKNYLEVKPELILPIRRIYQGPPCSERCFNFSFIFEFGKRLKTCMIIYLNAVRCHPLRKNLWNHVTWMSYSQSTGVRKRVESVKNLYFISKNLYINICRIPILGRDIVSRARFQDWVKHAQIAFHQFFHHLHPPSQTLNVLITFTCMHLADAFIQSDLQCI